MLELVEVHTTHLPAGEPERAPLVTWINAQQIVRIDACDTRTQHDGELAMIVELTNGHELYIPITNGPDAVETAVAQAVQALLSRAGGPIVGFEIE